MSYVPPHLRKKLVLAPAPVEARGLRFLGNAIGNDVVGNTGLRFSPHKNAIGAKKTLKVVKRMTPNSDPPAKPTKAFSEMPPKFRAMIKARLTTYKAKKKQTQKKHKKQKKQKKQSRKIHRHK
jgi:spore germination cell wall hydrolase CwlJ-like protein